MSKKRKKLRLIKIIVYSILIIILLSAFFSFIFFSGVFSIKDVQVVNNNKVSTEAIVQESNIRSGENLFLVKEKRIKENLGKIPYIEDISLKKIIPNKIEINVKEREPQYLIKSNENYYLIDKDGMILEKVENIENNVLRVLVLSTNIEENNIGNKLENNDISKIKNVETILQVAETNDLADLITKIDISNEQDIVIEIASESKLAHLGNFNDDINLNVKFSWLKTMLEQEKGKSGVIFLNVDLSKKKVVFSEQNI